MFQVGLGEYVITDKANESIITNALGSCVALIVYCKTTKCAAMAHIVLSNRMGSKSDPSQGEAYYADEITPRILDYFLSRPGCDKKDLVITLVGGSISKNHKDYFKVGQNNLKVIKDILEEYFLKYNDQETLGHYSRTVRIYVDTGEIVINKNMMLI